MKNISLRERYKNSKLLTKYGAQFSSFVALVILCIILAFMTSRFLRGENIMTVLLQSSINSILALGMTFIILTGNIDLSIGSIVALAAAVPGYLMVNNGLSPVLAILMALVLGTVCGLINGLIITKLNISAFIVTLGAMNVWRGLALQLTNGSTSYEFPNLIKVLGQGYIGPVPVPLVITIIVYVLASILLSKTPFGLSTYAIGGNESASKLSGIKVNRIKIELFCINGFLCGLAGLVLAGRLNSTMGVMATGYELDAIAAVAIGGTSMLGGEGNAWGSLIGALLMGIIRNGLNLMSVTPYMQTVAVGVIIIFAVAIDAIRSKRR